MNGFKITLLAVIALNILITVYMVDKPRDPITPGVAVFSIIWAAGIAALVVGA